MSLPTPQVLKYINLARQYPKYYVALIDQQLNSFVDQLNIKLEKDVLYETIEGKIAWEEARTFLSTQQPLRPLDFHEGLSKSVYDLAKDIVNNQSNGHQGSDGSTFIERIQRYCKKGKGSMIQLLGTTHKIPGKNSIELALLNLIIDDGVSNRGHRRALFNKEYRYVGAEFIQNEDRIYSVIAMTQANLETITTQPQSIATSTSHLKTLTEISSEIKENLSTIKKSKENCIDLYSSFNSNNKDVQKLGQSCISPRKSSNIDHVWTLKNVSNDPKAQSEKKVFQERNENQFYAEPSIFKEVNESVHTIKSNKPSQQIINQYQKIQKEQKTESKKNVQKASSYVVNTQVIKQMSQSNMKQMRNSKRNSNNSIHSDLKYKTGTSQGFGVSSEVQKFKPQNSLNSPFAKGTKQLSSTISSTNPKKVIEKKETKRVWCEDEFMIKQITTIVKYEDGTMDDFVEKHSVLKNSESYLKQQSV